jgi:hypothetical protein
MKPSGMAQRKFVETDRARLFGVSTVGAYKEPGTGQLPPAEGFSTVIGDGRPCRTGTPENVTRRKGSLFPAEGGPAILEVVVPAWIMAILYADSIASGLAKGGEIRFEPECGLNELRTEWHNLTKRIVSL